MHTIIPRPSDLGDGFMVRRALPAAMQRAVGPFVFLDEMGPAQFEPGHGLDVRPHPHIGLATVTYLFEGEILHRDSLGTVVPIRPGDVNWMTAGRGIVHSERTPPELRATGSRLWGLQFWVALPVEQEACDPSFSHHDASALPQTRLGGARLRLVAGSAYGLRSPVRAPSPLFLLDVHLAPGAHLELEDRHAERAAYVVEGTVRTEDGGQTCTAGHLLVFDPGAPVLLEAGDAGARCVLFGGSALDAPRFLWWNFVSSQRERIADAKARWAAQTFASVAGETDFVPLPPERPPPPA